MKGEILSDQDGTPTSFYFECPACKIGHSLVIRDGVQGMPSWSWNKSIDAPTFAPSLLVRWRDPDGGIKAVCHSYITDGQIRFLEDCTHDLAGKTVDMLEYAP